MATILQCKFCNKPFHSVGGKICPSCLIKIDEDYTIIRDFIYDTPGEIDIDSICEGAGVDKKVVLQLIEDKRLVFSTPISGGPTCSICHKPINSGSMCEDCKLSLSNTLSTAVVKPVEKKKDPVHYSKPSAKMHVKRDSDRK